MLSASSSVENLVAYGASTADRDQLKRVCEDVFAACCGGRSQRVELKRQYFVNLPDNLLIEVYRNDDNRIGVQITYGYDVVLVGEHTTATTFKVLWYQFGAWTSLLKRSVDQHQVN